MDEQKAMSMAAQLRKPHGEWAEQIADFMAVGNAVLINRAIDAMNLSDNDNVLEIGMGKGKHVADMIAKAKNLQYTGYDYSEEMVELATATNDELVTRNVATFVHGDALSMPFAEDTFDKIVTVNTVYFWDDAQAVATEILRVLKPNGKFILGLRPERLMKTYPMTKFGFAMYSKEGACDMLKQYGFDINDAYEEDEPPIDVDGEKFVLSSLIVTACAL